MATENVIEIPNRGECQHEWREEYYGWRCQKCKLFFAFGCAPWEFAEDEDFDTFDGESDDSEFDCAMDRDGNCGMAGSEECDFECPYNQHGATQP